MYNACIYNTCINPCVNPPLRHNQYIKIFGVCASVTIFGVCASVMDVGVAVTNLRFVCKTITCVSAFTEMAIIFLEIVKAQRRYDKLNIINIPKNVINIPNAPRDQLPHKDSTKT